MMGFLNRVFGVKQPDNEASASSSGDPGAVGSDAAHAGAAASPAPSLNIPTVRTSL